MIYSQSTGDLFNADGSLIGTGYAGNNQWKNDPASQNVKDHGPLPQGWYTIGSPYSSPQTGPFTLPLTPDPSNEMFDREGFKIHGDNVSDPGFGSDGCIVMTPEIRHAIWNGPDHILQVVA